MLPVHRCVGNILCVFVCLGVSVSVSLPCCRGLRFFKDFPLLFSLICSNCSKHTLLGSRENAKFDHPFFVDEPYRFCYHLLSMLFLFILMIVSVLSKSFFFGFSCDFRV